VTQGEGPKFKPQYCKKKKDKAKVCIRECDEFYYWVSALLLQGLALS
jgi:hypothetical protein